MYTFSKRVSFASEKVWETLTRKKLGAFEPTRSQYVQSLGVRRSTSRMKLIFGNKDRSDPRPEQPRDPSRRRVGPPNLR